MTDARSAPSRAIADGVLAGWLQLGVAVAAGPAYTALLLATLPRSEAAFWLVVVSLAAYLSLFDVGLGPTLTRFVAFARGTADAARPGRSRGVEASPADLFHAARRLYHALAVVLLGAGAALGPALFERASGLPVGGARAHAWLLFVIGCTANLLAAPYFAVAAGFGLVSVQRVAWAVAQAAGLALCAPLLLAGWGVLGVGAAWAGQGFVLMVVALLVVRRRCPEAIAGGRYRADVARALLGPSARWAGISLGAALILASGPMIVARQVGPDAVAPFVVLRQLAETVFLLALVPAQMSEPFVARSAAAGDDAGVVAYLGRNVRHVGALLVVGSLTAAVLGREVVAAWVGPQHFAGYVSLWLMLLVYVLEGHHVVHALVVMATGRVVFVRAALVAGVLTIGGGLLLARAWGVPGMIAAMLGAQLATNNWYAPRYALRLFRVPLAEYGRWLRPLLPLAAAALAAALVVRAILLAGGGARGAPAVLAALAATGLATLPLLWWGALSVGERRDLTARWRQGAGT